MGVATMSTKVAIHSIRLLTGAIHAISLFEWSNGKCVSSSYLKIICPSGFSSSDSSCLPFPKNCASLDSHGKCSSCTSNRFELENGNCAIKECPKGQFIANNGECECPSGEQMIRSRCHKLPENCLRLSPHLACERCESGYRFDRGDCVFNRRLTIE